MESKNPTVCSWRSSHDGITSLTAQPSFYSGTQLYGIFISGYVADPILFSSDCNSSQGKSTLISMKTVKHKTLQIPYPAKILIMALLVVVCVGTGYLLAMRDWASTVYLYLDRVDDARRIDPTQSRYAKTRGDTLLRQTIPPRLNSAATEYLKALRLAPNNVVHWRDWSEVTQRGGRSDLAAKALKTAEFLAPNDHLVQMEIGNYLLGEGRTDDAAQYHRRAIELRPSLAPTIYPVYWAMGWTAPATAHRLLTDDPELLCRYWVHSLEWLEPNGARELWDETRQTHGDVFDANSYKRYFDFLIANGEYGEAKNLWGSIVDEFYADLPIENDEKDECFWNGDFKYRDPAFDGGLEWRISKSPPAETRAVISSSRGLRQNDCLWVHFSGKENIAFSHVRHSLFVEPGKTYSVKYRVSSLDITTDNGPYVRITVFSDKPLVTKGPVVRNTVDWNREETFSVPESAHWAEIAICRDQSSKLNNRIKGDVWFDDFTLEEIVVDSGGEENSR